MAHKPSLCDLCGKEADPELEECWQVVCIAPHEEDLYHEKCIQKFMRAMPGKNYDPSRRSGLPCPRGMGKGTQYAVKCPCKVSHCQKVILKASQRSSASSSQAAAPAQAPAPKPPAPKPKPPAPKPAKPAAGSKPAKAPENTWVPQKAAVQEPAGPKIDPLGRNAAAAAAAASKAAKKNAKRAAAKQQRREQTTAADGSISDTSSMAESGAVASVWSTDAGGAAGGRDSNAGDAGEDWDDGEDYDLDADQLLLLELLKKQRGKQPHELLSFAHSDTTRADSSSEEEEHEEEQQHQQQQHEAVSAPGAGQPLEPQQQYPAVPPGFQQQESVMQLHQHATWAPQQHLLQQQLPLQTSSVSASPAGIDVSGLQQQLAASSISAPHFPAHPQHTPGPMQPPQQPYPTQQQFPASAHLGLPGYSNAGGRYVGPVYSGVCLAPQPAVPEAVPPPIAAAADGEQEDCSTDELLALLMGG